MNNELIKITPLPGVEIIIEPSKLLFDIAEQTSPEKIAFALLERFGANPLLDAIKQGFIAKAKDKPTSVAEVEKPKVFTIDVPPVSELKAQILRTAEPPELPEPPEMPKDLQSSEKVGLVEEFLSKPAIPKPIRDQLPIRECARPACKKAFQPTHVNQAYHPGCSKLAWEEKNRQHIKDYAQRRYEAKKQQSTQISDPGDVQEGE